MLVVPRLVAVALLTLACAASVSAADITAVANGTFTREVWETEDGLPHNSIGAVVQREDGFLWVATQGGLVRFDGVDFVPVRSPLINGVQSSGVGAMIEEDRDTLLFASTQSGLLRWRKGVVSRHPLAEQIGDERKIKQLFREDDDVFWIVFTDHEAWRCAKGTIQRFAAPAGIRTFWPPSFALDRRGGVYLARGAGIERFADDELRTAKNSPTSTVTIASSRRDGIWLATGRRLAKYSNGQIKNLGAPWQGSIAPTEMFEDRQGVLWLAAYEQGLVRWDNGAATAIPTSHVRILALADDTEGNLWAATSGGGLNRIQRMRLTLVADEPGWADTVSGAVCEDANGNLWFANRKNVTRLSPDLVQTHAHALEIPKLAFPIAADAAGNLWFANGADIFRTKIDGNGPAVAMGTVPQGSVHVIYPARDGSVWIGRNSGPLMRYCPDGRVESFGRESGYIGHHVRSIAEDAAGTIWVGTEEGRLFSGRNGAFTEPLASLGLPPNAIRAIYPDTNGNVWLGTAGAGIVGYHGGKISVFGQAEGLPDDVISQLLADDFGWLWCGSRRGIFKLQLDDLVAGAERRVTLLTPVSFGRADGLSGISAVGSYQPTAWKARSGELWFVTRKGLVKTDPALHERERRPPPVYLEAFMADGVSIDTRQPRVRSSARKLEFRFTAPTYMAPERVRFRYRLSGFDPDWVDGDRQRFASYPALPPGKYLFTVTASHGDLDWNPRGATLAFTVLPEWWQTWWAQGVFGAVGLCSLVGAVRFWSHRRLKARLAHLEQEQRLEHERVRIARNLHDDLGASLTHAGMMADELAEDWQDLPDAPSRSAQLARVVRTIARDLDAVVWTVSPKHDNLAALSSYLCHYADEYFRHTGIECHASVGNGIPPVPLSPDVRHHLFMIAKELLNNVLKHSRAKRVTVRMEMVAGIFELSVADDGHGFSVVEAEGSQRNGLKNLHARAVETGGVLDFESSPAGTVATLQFRSAARPLAAPAEAGDEEPVRII